MHNLFLDNPLPEQCDKLDQSCYVGTGAWTSWLATALPISWKNDKIKNETKAKAPISIRSSLRFSTGFSSGVATSRPLSLSLLPLPLLTSFLFQTPKPPWSTTDMVRYFPIWPVQDASTNLELDYTCEALAIVKCPFLGSNPSHFSWVKS